MLGIIQRTSRLRSLLVSGSIMLIALMTVTSCTLPFGANGTAELPDPLELDLDDDGQISRNEAAGDLATHFDHIDTNGDGFISMEELLALQSQMSGDTGGLPPEDGEAGFSDPLALDLDGDGQISRNEAAGDLATNFDFADTNGDGFIDMQELQALQSQMGAAPQSDATASNGQPASSGGDGVQIEAGLPDLAQMDQDGDGQISRNEAAGRLAQNFDLIDTDGDGFLNTNELFWISY